MKIVDCRRDAVALEYRPYFHQALVVTILLLLIVGFQGSRLGVIMPLGVATLGVLVAFAISGLLSRQPYSSILGSIVFLIVASAVVIWVSQSDLSFGDFADGDDIWFLPLLALGTYLSRGLRDIIIVLNLAGMCVVFLVADEQIMGREFSAVNFYTFPVTGLHFL